jgi:S-adenosylmethionine uptake transporter
MENLRFDFNKAKGISWFILNLVISVTNDVIMKFLGGDLSAYQIVFLRFLFGSLVLVPFIFTNRKSFETSRLLLHISRGGILFLGIAAWCLGLNYGKLAVATTINFTIPIFILLLATKFLNEKFTMTKAFATFVGFLGIVVIVNPASTDFNGISLMLVISAFLFASLDVINKKFVSVEPMLSMLFYSNLFAALFSAGPALYYWNIPAAKSLLLLFILGAGSNLILYCLLKSFSYIEVSAVASYRYLELLLSFTLGYIFFKEKFNTTNYIGAAIIIASTLIMSYEYLLTRRLNKKKKL